MATSRNCIERRRAGRVLCGVMGEAGRFTWRQP
jgi:hypothetical protein